MKKGFTLIELLVVIGILGILSGVLLGTLSGGTASAREARCLSNLRNLAVASQSYMAEKGNYPLAGSCEYSQSSGSSKKIKANKRKSASYTFHETPGWISWNSAGKYRGNPTASIANSGWNVSTYDPDDTTRLYVLTNGCLWKHIGANRNAYVCPGHVKADSSLKPNWSYVMNAYFRWSPNPGSASSIDQSASCGARDPKSLGKPADRLLLFAEMQWASKDRQGIRDLPVSPKKSTGSGTDCDCILQYNSGEEGSGTESIGFNHKVGKQTYGNVVFADGHVEKLVWPNAGMSELEMQELTTWLCSGIDVKYESGRYSQFNK